MLTWVRIGRYDARLFEMERAGWKVIETGPKWLWLERREAVV